MTINVAVWAHGVMNYFLAGKVCSLIWKGTHGGRAGQTHISMCWNHQSSTQPWMGTPWLNKLTLCCAKDIFVTSIFSTTSENKIEEIFFNVFIKTFFKGISGAKTALLLWQELYWKDTYCTGLTSKNWHWRTDVILKMPVFSLSRGEGVRVLCYGSVFQHCSGQYFRFLSYRNS